VRCFEHCIRQCLDIPGPVYENPTCQQDCRQHLQPLHRLGQLPVSVDRDDAFSLVRRMVLRVLVGHAANDKAMQAVGLNPALQQNLC
jgi:hypothetical protein